MKQQNNVIEHPSLSNTVMKETQINTRPVFVNKTKACEMFGVGKTTLYRWTNEAEKLDEFKGLSVRPSPTVTLIHVETMEKFIRFKNKHFL